jgi:hypothetical protein
MADIANAVVEPVPAAGISDIVGAVDPFVAGTTWEFWQARDELAPPAQYLQKIYDTNVMGFVYYTRVTTDPTTDPPLTTDTEPNHTNNLVLSTHAVLKEV